MIEPLSGTVTLGDYLSIGYFEQEMKRMLRPTCMEEIWKEFPSYTQYEVRSALAKCGLTTKHIESLVRVLSGGEQAKVRLCLYKSLIQIFFSLTSQQIILMLT